MDTDAADAAALLPHQNRLLQLSRLHRRTPAGGPGTDDDKVEMLRHCASFALFRSTMR
jgi:hypothetical protein